MVKVITYGSYDMLHYGHIRLLERAKALGDYLIVGVTSDDYDKTRGKINLQQTLMERVEAVRATGIPDEVIVEEYEGQKIDDIRNYGVDIFTVGSDWKGYFDYLSDYCKVVYLDRTEGVSSTEIRSRQIALRMGVVGSAKFIEKMVAESDYVNGIEVVGVCTDDKKALSEGLRKLPMITEEYDSFLDQVDAVGHEKAGVEQAAREPADDVREHGGSQHDAAPLGAFILKIEQTIKAAFAETATHGVHLAFLYCLYTPPRPERILW